MSSSPERFSGVLSPVVTPFNDDLSIDPDRLISQCQWLLSQNVGLAVFGTNSEANSMSVGEKMLLLDRLIEGGIDPGRMMPGTGCCALTDTVQLTSHAVKLGCAGSLMLPPFYYKGVSDDGLFRSYAEIIERVGSSALRIYLYHIPPIAQVGISLDLIERLIKAYPNNVVGVKDSSGDWGNTESMLQRGWDDFRVFCGSESFLLQTMQQGGAGCISATANINPAAIHKLFVDWQSANADSLQQGLNTIRDLTQSYPMIPALKSVVAAFGGRKEWGIVRPPLVALAEPERKALVAQLKQAGFRMPGLSARL
jgi:4-hydroxy-tetrahydrodipicolinate synthase